MLRRGAMVMCLVAGLLLGSGSTAGAAEPLVAQWPFDSHQTTGAGDVTYDVSGNNLTLTSPAGTMQMGTAGGKFGGYLSSSNVNTLQVTSPLLAPAQLTLLAWIKQNGDPGVLHYIAGRGDDAGNCGGSSYALYTGYSGSPGLHFYIRSGNQNILTDVPATSTVFDGNWHLIAGTYDGTSIRLFVDGTQIGAAKPAGAINYSLPDSSFYVDGYPYAACGGSPDFPGLIDEARVYDRALTATELGRLAAAPGPTPPTLVPDAGSTTTTSTTSARTSSTSSTATATVSAIPTPTVSTSASATSPASAAPPVASFRPIASALAPKGTTILDASQSSGATTLKWDLSGDGKPDVTCPASQPYIALTPQATIKGSIGLQASRGSGVVSFTSQPLTLLNPAAAVAPAGAVKYGPPSVAVCATSASAPVTSPLNRVPLQSVVTALLCTQQTVVAQLISAQGCFVHTTDENNVPTDVRQIVHNDYASTQESAVAAFYCTRIGQTLPDGTLVTQALCDYTKQEFDVHYDVYVSSTTVDLDGITVKPLGDSSIVVFPELQRIIASNALMTWGGAPVRTGEIDLNLGNDIGISHIDCTTDYACGGSQSIARYSGQDLQSIAGFSVDGSVDLALAGINGQRYSIGTVRLKLPGEFALFGGDPPSGTVQVTAQNGTGLQLDSLDLEVPSADIGPVSFTNVAFRYATHGHLDNDDCSGDEWKAQADVFLDGGDGGGTGFQLAPPPSQNGIGFCQGSFHNAGGAVMFSGAAAPEIFPGVFLDNFNFALQLDPFLVRIGGGVNVGDISRVTGTALLAFPTINHTYTLSAQDAGQDLAALAGRVLSATTIAAGGTVSVNFPGLGYIGLGSGAAMYSLPNYIYAAGAVHLFVPGMSIDGGASLETRLGTGYFQAHVGGTACLAGIKDGVCLGADGYVTSSGMVACFTITVFGQSVHPGAGIDWAHRKLKLWPVDGCKPSEFGVVFGPARAAAANTLTFKVVKGETVKNLRLAGTGAPPIVRVTTPGGETLTVDGNDWVASRHMVGVRDTYDNATYFGIKNGTPGTYTITRLPGSSAFAGLEATRPGFDEGLTAKVTGTGATRRLVYDAGKTSPGTRISFAVTGGNMAQPIGTVSGGHGSIAFTPLAGPAGKRTIVATGTYGSSPFAPQTLASFRVGAARPIGRSGGVRVRRVGKTLHVSWSPVPGATSYGLVAQFDAGSELQRPVKAGRRSFVVAGVPLTESGTVRVSAMDALGHWGKPRVSNHFKATQAFPSAFQTKTHNERLTELAALRAQGSHHRRR